MSRTVVLVFGLVLGALGCQQILGLEEADPRPAPEPDPPAPECEQASDCPTPSGPCTIAVCQTQMCDEELVAAQTACGDGRVCDGQGECVEPCAGLGQCEPNEVMLTLTWGGLGNQSILAVQTTDSEVVVAGVFDQQLEIDDANTLVPPGSAPRGLFVVWLNLDGSFARSTVLGLTGDFNDPFGSGVGLAMELDREGDVVLFGELVGTLAPPDESGLGPITTGMVSFSDRYVAVRLSTDGAVTALRHLAAGNNHSVSDVAVATDGTLVIAGFSDNELQFDALTISAVSSTRRYVVAFGADLTADWGYGVDPAGLGFEGSGPLAVARFNEGFMLAGEYRVGSQLEIGGMLYPAGSGAFFIQLDAPAGVATQDPSDAACVAMNGRMVADANRLYVPCLGRISTRSASDPATVLWAEQVNASLHTQMGISGGALTTQLDTIADEILVTGAGNKLMVGDSVHGGQDLPPGVLFARIAAGSGALLTAATFVESNGSAVGRGVDGDTTGTVWVGGSYTGTVDFGRGPLPDSTASDAFLVRLAR